MKSFYHVLFIGNSSHAHIQYFTGKSGPLNLPISVEKSKKLLETFQIDEYAGETTYSMHLSNSKSGSLRTFSRVHQQVFSTTPRTRFQNCDSYTTPKTTKNAKSSSKSTTHHFIEQHAKTAILDYAGAYQASDRQVHRKNTVCQ